MSAAAASPTTSEASRATPSCSRGREAPRPCCRTAPPAAARRCSSRVRGRLARRCGPCSPTAPPARASTSEARTRSPTMGRSGARPNTTHGTGVYLDGATLEKGDIVSTGTQLGYGVEGDGKVVDSSVTASDYSYGIYGPRTVQRTTIQGAGTGVLAAGSALPYQLDQLRIAVPAGGKGISAETIGSADTLVNADHVTVTGGADGSSVGVLAAAYAGASPHNAKIVLRSSIVRRVGHPVGVTATNGTANIEVDHSDVNLAAKLVSITQGGSGAVTDMGANLNVDPLFVSGNDRHLQPGSPVLDKGRPNLQPGESVTDLDGLPRLVGPAADMGAYEHP